MLFQDKIAIFRLFFEDVVLPHFFSSYWNLQPVVKWENSSLKKPSFKQINLHKILAKIAVIVPQLDLKVPQSQLPKIILPHLKKLPTFSIPTHTIKLQYWNLKPAKKKSFKTISLQLHKPQGNIFKQDHPLLNSLKKAFPIALIYLALLFPTFRGLTWLNDEIFLDLPTVQDLVSHRPNVSSKILDRDGRLLFTIYENENRRLINLEELPAYVPQATIAIEDQHFYQHNGFDFRGIARAVVSNYRGEAVQGGSTITQQLVKNTLLTTERTLQRKLRELLLAVAVEAHFDKNSILEMYLNEVSYGGSTYGIEEAAQRFFGKSAKDLTLAEASLLAGLPAAPSAFSPFGPTPEQSQIRQAEVLRRMVEDGYISAEQAQDARREQINLKNNAIDIKAPHFVMYVRDLLAKQYGEESLKNGGLTITTTLDLETQLNAERAVREELESLAALRVSNGAAMVTDPRTGEILAMVGSKNYFDFENDGQVNVTLRPRQPGSSIKPITYAAAFSKGDSPSTTIDDSPITYAIEGSKPYSPRNYDGKYHGRVTLRQALASSYNIPAVKLLAKIGISSLIDLAQKMGVSTWEDRSRFGLSLTLGGGEITMLDMTQVYGTFATQGESIKPNPILSITDIENNPIYENDCALKHQNCAGTQALDARVAAQITQVLSDNIARAPAFGTQSVLSIPNQEVAVKTGTTNNLRDNWTIGYTTDRVVAVWVGNNDNTPMSYVASGITGASPIWNTIMRSLLNNEHPHRFATPEGLIKVSICAATGTLPCQGCPSVRDEVFIPGTEPTTACTAAWFKPKPTATPGGSPGQILEGISF